MISTLYKTDFPNKKFDNGRLLINSTESNIEILIKKINELVEQVNKVEKRLDYDEKWRMNK